MLLHILIADDNPFTRETLARLLGQLGCHTVAVSDAGGALGALSAIKFDVLLLGAAGDDAATASLTTAARALQPALRVIVARTQAPPPGLADAFVALPATAHGLRIALQDALGAPQPRTPSPAGRAT